MHDRIRAAPPPPSDGKRWHEGVVRAVDRADGAVVVTVAGPEGPVEVRVTPAVFDLFTGRLDRSVAEPGDAVGATAWYR